MNRLRENIKCSTRVHGVIFLAFCPDSSWLNLSLSSPLWSMMDREKNMADGESFFFYVRFFSLFSFFLITVNEVAKLRAAEMNSVKFNHGN